MFGPVRGARKKVALATASFAGAVALACGGPVSDTPDAQREPANTPQQTSPTPTSERPATTTPEPSLTPSPTSEPSPSPTSSPGEDPAISEDLEKRFHTSSFSYRWKTDYSNRTVSLDEIQFLGLARDAIRPIYGPRFETIEEANDRVFDLEPVIVVEVNGEAKAYPQTILVAHEVIDDVIGGKPVAVTW